MFKQCMKAIAKALFTTAVVVLGFIGVGLISNLFTSIIQVVIFAIFIILCWAYYEEER